MIKFERTTDLEFVRTVMTHPKIWDGISDDGSPPPDQFSPADSPAIHYVVAHDETGLIGVWAFYPQNSVCFDVHTMMMPRARGRRAVDAAQSVAAWMFEQTACKKITTTVPSCNPQALWFAKKAGMKVIGVNEKSFVKNGEIFDQTILGIQPEDLPCQQP